MKDKAPMPSAFTIGLSVAATLYLLWALLLPGQETSLLMAVIYWVIVVLNLLFLGGTLLRMRK